MFKVILVFLTIIFGLAFCIFLIAELIIEYIKDRKGDAVGEQVKKLEDSGYEVEVDKGIIYIILEEKDYYSTKFRKGIKDIMKNYSKSYGIRLKGSDKEWCKSVKYAKKK